MQGRTHEGRLERERNERETRREGREVRFSTMKGCLKRSLGSTSVGSERLEQKFANLKYPIRFYFEVRRNFVVRASSAFPRFSNIVVHPQARGDEPIKTSSKIKTSSVTTSNLSFGCGNRTSWTVGRC